MKLPGSLDDITPEWATVALGERAPGVRCRAVEVEHVVPGSAVKARLRLDYESGSATGLPETMYAKGGLGGPMAAMAGAAYAQEVRFFRELAPDLPVRLPACYAAVAADDGSDGILLLEDLEAAGARFGRAAEPVTVDEAAATLELHARLHAHRWEDRALLGADWLSGGGLRMVMDILTAPDHWNAFLEMRSEVVPEPLRDRELVLRCARAMFALDDAAPVCLIHGDAHLDNMYFVADGPGLLDWQTIQRGPWIHDVAYFLIGSMDIEDRRKHERDLLRHYLERLGAAGVAAPSFEEAFLYYRQHVWHGFFWWLTPVEMQPDATSRLVGTRFTTAALDLDSRAAIGL